MSKLKKIIVLDFEGKSTERPYNVGIVVGDKHGNIYREYSISFPETFQENITANSGVIGNRMSKNNIDYIMSHPLEFRNATIENFTQFLFKLIEIDNITEFWAYNMSFDKSALKRLIGLENFTKLCQQVTFYDIIPIVTPRLLTKKYVKFCTKHGYITNAKNLQTTAEIVYRYLFNNVNYIERHLGLEDAKDEYKILCKIFKQKKKLIKEYTSKPKPYRQLKQFCEVNRIEID